MNRLIATIAAAALLIAPLAASAQTRTARIAFVNAPDDIFLLLKQDARLDMVDYFMSNMDNTTANALEGESRITAMTDDLLTVEASASATYHVVILPAESADKDDVVAVITTVAAPARDSRIAFYNARTWEPLDSRRLMPELTLKSWLTDEGRRNRSTVESMVPFVLAEYTYDPATLTLTARSTLRDFLSPEINEIVTPYLRSALSMRWNGKKLELK